jgi:hypothetical protein
MPESRYSSSRLHHRVCLRVFSLLSKRPLRLPAWSSAFGITLLLPMGEPADLLYPGLILGLLSLLGVAIMGGIGWYLWARERRQQADSPTPGPALVAERRHKALQRHFNPYISGEPVREADMFFGRDELLRKIINGLHQNSVMIHGERRIGKTSLLFHLAEQLRQAEDPEWVFIPVSMDLEGTPQNRFFYLLIEAVWGVTRAYLTKSPPRLRYHQHDSDVSAKERAAEYTDRDFASDLRVLVEALKTLVRPHRVRVVLLMDEVDVFGTYDTLVQQQFRRILVSDLAQNVGAVVAGAHINKSWDRQESPWYNLFIELPLEPFTREQARTLLVEPVQDVYQWDEAAIAYVLARAEGRPHRLQRYALEAVNRILAENRLRITVADVRAADQAIDRTGSC